MDHIPVISLILIERTQARNSIQGWIMKQKKLILKDVIFLL